MWGVSKESRDKSAKKRGFREHREFDKAWKRAKRNNIPFDEYCECLDKDEDGFYILPERRAGRPKKKNA